MTTVDIPKVALCTQTRSGSSMVMRMLEAGGLVVSKGDKPEDEASLYRLRNPYGTFEVGSKFGFVNSIKFMNPDGFSGIPSNYVKIYLYRDIGEIFKSWKEVWSRSTQPNINADKILDTCKMKKEKWTAIMDQQPNILKLEYNWVCANPLKAAQAMSTVINTPTFSFNVDSASKAVDTSLYRDRSTDIVYNDEKAPSKLMVEQSKKGVLKMSAPVLTSTEVVTNGQVVITITSTITNADGTTTTTANTSLPMSRAEVTQLAAQLLAAANYNTTRQAACTSALANTLLV